MLQTGKQRALGNWGTGTTLRGRERGPDCSPQNESCFSYKQTQDVTNVLIDVIQTIQTR
jgi:hypothetical protein